MCWFLLDLGVLEGLENLLHGLAVAVGQGHCLLLVGSARRPALQLPLHAVGVVLVVVLY